MSLPAWKKRALIKAREKTAEVRRVDFLHTQDMQELLKITGLSGNLNQVMKSLEGNRTMEKHVLRYYAAKFAAASKRGEYGRFVSQSHLIDAERAAVAIETARGKTACCIERMDSDVAAKASGWSDSRVASSVGVTLPEDFAG